MITCSHETAVVILSYNGKNLHNDFLPKILSESTSNYDVVLIDNASTDDTLAFVNKNFPEVKTLHLDVNKGFANGYAEGLKKIKAKYYILLSADFEVTSNWFLPLKNCLESNKNIAAVQPKIKFYKDKTMFEYAGAGGGFIDKYGYLFCRGRIFFDIEKDEHQYDDDIEVFWTSGGCMMIRSEIYHQVGGLDADLYAHMEEVDLCWRIKNTGYDLAYCGKSTVYHIGGSVISYGSPQKIFYNYRNSLILLTKNLSFSKWLWLFPFRLFLDGVSAFRSLIKGNFVEIKMIFLAHWSFFLSFGKWWKKRNDIQQFKITNTKKGIYNNSILVDYFLRKKKTFSELNQTFLKRI
ncbi:MAG: glycosyltransferase family 2 protein [Chitinophagaceae bacterium]|nr:glycosyltransferase family 2 protein [Chitinophagaceae bacterium]